MYYSYWLEKLKLGKENISQVVLCCGTPKRLELLLKYLSDPYLVCEFLAMKTFTGKIGEIPVTITSTGFGSPDSVFSLELLFKVGGDYTIRVGSAGALSEELNIGDLLIVTGAVRGEGTSNYYAPLEYPAVPDPIITNSLIEAAEKLKIKYKLGFVWTIDAIFKETPDRINLLNSLGVKCVDMICSSLFITSSIYGKKAGAILAISDNVKTNEIGFNSKEFQEAEEKASLIAFESVKILKKRGVLNGS